VWKVTLRLMISLATIAIVFHEINFTQFVHYLWTIHIVWYVGAILLQIFSALIAAYKWDLVMKNMNYTAPFSFFARTYFIGTVFNQVLPTSVGGDAVRIAYTNKLHAGLRQAFNGVMVDRYYGTAGLVFINIIALFWSWTMFPRSIFLLILLIIGLVSAGLIFALIVCKMHFLKRLRITHVIYELSQAIIDNAYSWQRTIVLLLLAVLANFITILGIYCIALALNLPISLLSLLAVMPAITLITLLPISFAGWGIREGAMVSFLLFLGLPKTAIFSLSVLYGIMLILSSLPGLYFYLVHKH
jgi:uncharacterized protein (TIRG00374 family)